MLSKMKTVVLILLYVLFSASLITGCSYFFDSKEEEKTKEFKSDHASCLEESDQVLKGYFDDFSDDEKANREVKELGLCYQKAIESFAKFTKSGEEDDSEYSSENIQKFFEAFYPQMGMSLSKIKGYFEFKHYLIGGSKTTITKDELMAIHDLLPTVTEAMREMIPYRQIIMGEAELAQDQPSRELFYKAFTQFKKVAGRLVHSLKPWKTQRSADINSLGNFVVNEYYADEVEDKKPMIPLIISFKNLSLNEGHEFLRRKDMASFVTQSIRTYEALSEFNYFIKDRAEEGFFTSMGTLVSFIIKIPSQLTQGQKFKGVALSSLVNIIDNSRYILSLSAKRDDKGLISIDKVSDFIHALEAAKYMGGGKLTAPTLSYFIKQFSDKWLISSNKEIKGDIDRQKIAYVDSVVKQWSHRQNYINQRLKDKESINLADLSKDTEDPEIKKWLSVFDKTALHQWMSDGRIRYSSNKSDFSYEELTVSNSIFTLVYIFSKPFALDKEDVLEFSVKKSGAQEIYSVLRILGVEMGFVDARVKNSGENTFDEGNNFSTQKKGDDGILTFYEAYEVMSVSFASGMRAKKIHAGFVEYVNAEKNEKEKEACLLKYNDVFHYEVMGARCFREHLMKNFASYFSHLRSFNKYWQQASDLDKEKFIGVVELSARGGVISQKPFDMGELRVMSGTMYYFESIFHNFDKDQDGIIFNEETFAAEKHFRPFIIDFIKKKKPDVLASLEGLGGKTGIENLRTVIASRVFMHLIRHGELPGEGAISGALLYYRPDMAYTDWAKTKREGLVKHDRVIKVFGALADATGRGHRSKVENFLLEKKDDLYESMDENEVPDCRHQKELPFCVWARLIYCNESVNDELHQWMLRQQHFYFSNDRWENDRDATVKEAMVDMSRFFRNDKVFSVQCGFPEIEPGKGSWASFKEWSSDTVNGTETEKGWKEELGETWNSLFGD